MARWVNMSVEEKITYLQNRLDEIKTCQRLLSEFERITSFRMDALNDEIEEQSQK